MKIKTVIISLSILAICTAGWAQSFDKVKADLLFDRLAEKNKAMGTILLMKDGNTLYNRSIGYSQISGSDKKPITADTRFRVGSVTKMFTAAMILQLAYEKKLKLTDNLAKFFPQVRNAAKITVEQLLAHRAGIHEVTNDGTFNAIRIKGITKDEMLAAIAKSEPDFEPGAKYAYSSAGYFLLGSIIEKLTGMSYADALKKRITTKLGLPNTYPATGNIDPAKNESFSYRYLSSWEAAPETHPGFLFGSGSLVSTTADMARFIRALFDGRVISKESLTRMTAVKDGYGLGIETFTYNGKTFFGHTGGIDNFGSWLAYLPEEKLVLSYATNAKVYPVKNLIDNIFDIYYNKPFTVPTFDQFEVSTELLDKYTGVYSNPAAPVKFIITRDGSTLFAQPTGQTAVPLEATAADKFRIAGAAMSFEFDAGKGQMTIKRSGGERVFTKDK